MAFEYGELELYERDGRRYWVRVVRNSQFRWVYLRVHHYQDSGERQPAMTKGLRWLDKAMKIHPTPERGDERM